MNGADQGVQTLDRPDSVYQPLKESRTTGASSAPLWHRFLGWLLSTLPTLLILAMLAGLAWWGHHTGWKMPTFAELSGKIQTQKDDWCSEHGVPESQCFLCQPKMKKKLKSYGWCRVHGVFDCPLEHPEVVQLTKLPKITTTDREKAKRSLEFAPRPQNNNRCALHPTVVQLAAGDMVDKLGLKFEPVWTAPIEETVTANGEITYDQTKLAALATVAPGRVFRVEKQVGDVVRKGEVLALIDAAQVGKAKADLLNALAEVDLRQKNVIRLRRLSGIGVAEAQVLEAETLLRQAEASLTSAQQALINLGLPVQVEPLQGMAPQQVNRYLQFLSLPEAIVRTLDSRTTTANLIAVRASLDGVVVERKVVEGEMVDSSCPLFFIANTDTMWLKLFVRLEDVRYLKKGQTVRFHHDGSSTPAIGRLSWISTTADEKTRTVQVRADLTNHDGQLRASTFGNGTIVLRQEPDAIVVPNQSLHSDGNCRIVFVQDKNFHKKGAPKLFHVRTVRIGAVLPTQTEIVAGVLPGEILATEGSGALRAQLLKNNLGAG